MEMQPKWKDQSKKRDASMASRWRVYVDWRKVVLPLLGVYEARRGIRQMGIRTFRRSVVFGWWNLDGSVTVAVTGPKGVVS